MNANTDITTPLQASPGPPPRRPDAGMRLSLRILAVGLSLLMVGWGAFTLASLLARVSNHTSATYDGIKVVDIDVGFESVQIVGSADATAVTMDRSYTWSLGKPAIGNRKNEDVLSITSSCPFSVGLGCSGHIRLVVPKDAEIRADGSDGSIALRDLDGPVDVATSDGSVTASNLTGQVSLRSSDGSIDATGLWSDEVQAVTSDGAVQLGFEVSPASVTARSSDGSIEVVVPHDGTAYDVTATTSDGTRLISVPTDPSSSHRMELHTSDGSIRVVDRT